ncbi:MAG TPA: GNAT family N-acetyltransferase [Acidobacteriaceae bacterium]
MPTIRRATVDDAALITTHRHVMFADNQFATEDHLTQMDAAFEPWVRAHLANGSYIGLLMEDEQTKQILAGAGILFHDFPPHWMDFEPTRAYLLNFYTLPEARGHGHANLLLRACVEECRTRGVAVVTLHASRFGRPIYQKFGFEQSTEMMLRLNT